MNWNMPTALMNNVSFDLATGKTSFETGNSALKVPIPSYLSVNINEDDTLDIILSFDNVSQDFFKNNLLTTNPLTLPPQQMRFLGLEEAQVISILTNLYHQKGHAPAGLAGFLAGGHSIAVSAGDTISTTIDRTLTATCSNNLGTSFNLAAVLFKLQSIQAISNAGPILDPAKTPVLAASVSYPSLLPVGYFYCVSLGHKAPFPVEDIKNMFVEVPRIDRDTNEVSMSWSSQPVLFQMAEVSAELTHFIIWPALNLRAGEETLTDNSEYMLVDQFIRSPVQNQQFPFFPFNLLQPVGVISSFRNGVLPDQVPIFHDLVGKIPESTRLVQLMKRQMETAFWYVHQQQLAVYGTFQDPTYTELFQQGYKSNLSVEVAGILSRYLPPGNDAVLRRFMNGWSQPSEPARFV